MRLIDADTIDLENVDLLSAKGIKKLIKEQQTAYDVDKVVELLQKEKSGLTTRAKDEAYKLAIEKAIKIVRSAVMY